MSVDWLTHNHLLAAFVICFVIITLIVGLVDEASFFGEVLIVCVKYVKKKVRELRDVGKRLLAELTTWDSRP